MPQAKGLWHTAFVVSFYTTMNRLLCHSLVRSEHNGARPAALLFISFSSCFIAISPFGGLQIRSSWVGIANPDQCPFPNQLVFILPSTINNELPTLVPIAYIYRHPLVYCNNLYEDEDY